MKLKRQNQTSTAKEESKHIKNRKKEVSGGNRVRFLTVR